MSGELSEGSPKGRRILGNAITVTWSHLSPLSTYRPLRANMEGLNLIFKSWKGCCGGEGDMGLHANLDVVCEFRQVFDDLSMLCRLHLQQLLNDDH